MPKPTCVMRYCDRESKTRGLCHRHYMQRYRADVGFAEKLSVGRGEALAFVTAASQSVSRECIIWPWPTRGGYGHLMYEGQVVGAHRLVLILSAGPPPEGSPLAIHGPCHNPSCINPTHLSWGSEKQNSADELRDGTLPRGESHGRVKLTEDQVRMVLTCDRSNLDLATELGVWDSTICRIRQRKLWKHLKV